MKTHTEHETTVAIGRTQGFLLCLDCRTIIEDLPLCGEPTKRGGPCRWAVQVGADNATHPHTTTTLREQKPRPKKVRLESRPTMFISTAEAQWLRDLIKTRGRIDGQSIVLDGIKRGQAELIVGRYGGVADSERPDEWRWRCDGQQAEAMISALRMA